MGILKFGKAYNYVQYNYLHLWVIITQNGFEHFLYTSVCKINGDL